MTEKNWSFSINDEKQLDWQRLVADALAEGLDAFTVKLDSDDEYTAIFIRDALLEKATNYDEIGIAGYFACPQWGNDRAPSLSAENGGYCMTFRGKCEKIYHYRCAITKRDIGKIKTEIDTLRNFKRKAVVKVSSI